MKAIMKGLYPHYSQERYIILGLGMKQQVGVTHLKERGRGGEGIMASLAVILFLGAINGAMFWLGIKGKLSENELLNFILKRSLIILGLLFTSLNLAVLANIANNAGLGIRAEIFRYMWLFNWAIYIAIVFLMWGTVVRALGMWSDIAEKKSYGG